MTDYILIILAVICFAGQFAFTGLYEKAIRQTALTSLVMLTVTGLIGAALYLVIGSLSLHVSPVSLFWAACFALIMIPYYMIGIKVLSLGSLAIYSMFMMLGGMLVPFVYGTLFLHEELSLGKLLGTALLTLFIVLQAVWQKEPAADRKSNPTGRNKSLFFLLCLVIFMINGMTGVIAKAHQISEGAVDEVSFTVFSCALTALFSGLLLPFSFRGKRDAAWGQIREALRPRPLLIMALIAAAMHTGNFLHLKAASTVPASVQFPLVSGGVIVLSALVSAFLFREKISKKEWLSIAGAFASTVLFAF